MTNRQLSIVNITPGSGDNFYCENCLRDKAVVRALLDLGHKAMMVPLYLPIGDNAALSAATSPLFFGGINVYLQQKLRIFRWTPRWIDRLLDSPRLLRWAARKAGMTTPRDLGMTTISMLRGHDGRQRKELLRLVDWMADNERPDVVVLSNVLLIGLAQTIKDRLGVPVACHLQDEDEFLDALPPDLSARSWDLIRSQARHVSAFIAPSRYFADFMGRRLELPLQRVHVVRPGMDFTGYGPAPGTNAAGRKIGFMSRMYADKGLDLLVEAFIRLRSQGRFADVRLLAGGGQTDADRPYVAAIRRRLDEAHLAADTEFLPHLEGDDRRRFLQRLTVLSVPERRGSAAGLYVLEALACGVPVVQPDSGAFSETIKATGGGRLFAPGDAAALAGELAAMLDDPSGAARMGQSGRRAVLAGYTAKGSASHLLEVLAPLCD